MTPLLQLAEKKSLAVIEDAAQAIFSSYKGKPLGTIGQMGCFSFHETKNVISGEGGALLINDEKLAHRAEIIREKGTNRSQFFRGQVDKYTWCDIGSSYLPGELIAAFLWAQMEAADDITQKRMSIWNKYHAVFEGYENQSLIRRPVIPKACQHNGHMYYLLLPSLEHRTHFIASLKQREVASVFHYIPLHSAPAGKQFARSHGVMHHTDALSERLVRLPLWVGLDVHFDRVIKAVDEAVAESKP
jgi:dTDP-4-amino-4,6-dideoxygalactose transaminase